MATDWVDDSLDIDGGRSLITWAALGAAPLVYGVTTKAVTHQFARGPRLTFGDVFEEERAGTYGGDDLQVLNVKVFNERDSGGKDATASNVYALLEAFDPVYGERIDDTGGNWWRHSPTGRVMNNKATFPPTHESWNLELVAKYVSSERAYIAGQADPPSIAPGNCRLRVSLRGEGLKKAVVAEWRVINPGKGQRLFLSTRKP